MTNKEKKDARNKILDDAFNIKKAAKNGSVAAVVNNVFSLVKTPAIVIVIVVGAAIFLMLGNVNKSLKAIRDLPETCKQVDDNVEDIGVLFVYHDEQEERLDKLDDRILVQETRAHYAKRRVD